MAQNICSPQDITGHQCTNCDHVFTGTYGQMSREMLVHANKGK